MFDIGFWELVLVGTVALLVFGPERLPRVAREAALWIRKGRSMVASVKSEIDQELQLQELRETLQDEKRKLAHESASYKRILKRELIDEPAAPGKDKTTPDEGHEHE
jgi:sec-independent protein translocase protein TatB